MPSSHIGFFLVCVCVCVCFCWELGLGNEQHSLWMINSSTNVIFASSFFCLGAKNFWWKVHSDGYKKIMWVDISCWQPPVETFGWSYQSCACSNYWRENSWGDSWNISFAWWSHRGVLPTISMLTFFSMCECFFM